MLGGELEKLYPSAKTLVKEQVASRMHAKDATLFGFSEEAQACAGEFMGWTDLGSNPPCPLDEIRAFADEVLDKGLSTVLLIGEGGSTQAPMTITKYNKVDSSMVKFRTLDSDSPVRVRSILAECDFETLLVIISSKSGTTIEPRLALQAVRDELAESMGEDEVVRHLVAITDPGSELEQQALREGWLRVFNGEPSVGGRYSALSVFGLVPAALVGIDMDEFMEHAVYAEKRCSEDAVDNPAIMLAAFLYDNYLQGRDKFSFLTPKRGRVLGLWIEQLVAESLGKEGKGILPNIELDTLVLTKDAGDRTAIMYQTKTDLWDERKNFEMSLAYMDQAIPSMNFRIESVCELAEHFVMWEYAIAMCGYLMKVCPFDQPDVASAKAAVVDILENGHPEPDFTQNTIGDMNMGEIEVRLGASMKGAEDLEDALRKLFSSIEPGDYFATNAFLPFTGEGRREALELIRHTMADEFNVVSCLEVGPRYLHSTGQLQKGGSNNGVFLIISADELKDIPLVEAVAPSLSTLAKAQAEGDLVTLSEHGRRCMHVHLPDNSGVMLRQLGEVVQKVARSL
jgi:glucose-6-phosphate isomerase